MGLWQSKYSLYIHSKELKKLIFGTHFFNSFILDNILALLLFIDNILTLLLFISKVFLSLQVFLSLSLSLSCEEKDNHLQQSNVIWV